MIKIIYLLIILLSNASYSICELIQTHQYSKVSIERAKSVTKFGDVFIVCGLEFCHLICREQGELTCTFDNGFNNPKSCACIDERILFDEGNGQDMFDYADSQIDNDNFEGTYSNNLIISNNIIIYRTVNWKYVDATEQRDVNLVLTRVTTN